MLSAQPRRVRDIRFCGLLACWQGSNKDEIKLFKRDERQWQDGNHLRSLPACKIDHGFGEMMHTWVTLELTVCILSSFDVVMPQSGLGSWWLGLHTCCAKIYQHVSQTMHRRVEEPDTNFPYWYEPDDTKLYPNYISLPRNVSRLL